MKKIGNLIAVIGMIGGILGVSGYDSNPLIGGVMAVIGLVMPRGGYWISNNYIDAEEILGSSVKGDKSDKRSIE